MESLHTAESEKLRAEVTRLRSIEVEAKNNAGRVTALLEELEALRTEKSVMEEWAETYRDEMEQVSGAKGCWDPTLLLNNLVTLYLRRHK